MKRQQHTDEWPNLAQLGSDGKLPRTRISLTTLAVVWLFIMWIGGAFLRACTEALS